MGATAPALVTQTGFQHLKTLDALLAAQAIAHDDFDHAARQFRRILSYQQPDGALPFLVYGPSVDPTQRWFASDETFFPAPAFWRSTANVTDVNVAVLAPPIAADVAWQMYRLAPFESAMGMTAHTTSAVIFLCDVYGPLRRLHEHIMTSRRSARTSHSLLEAWHPWETLSAFSEHWRISLASLKQRESYGAFVKTIPATAKARYKRGAVMNGRSDAEAVVEDFFEPMMFLASCLSRVDDVFSSNRVFEPLAQPRKCGFAVHDVEFNTLVLRSTLALAEIARALTERASVCPSFSLADNELDADLEMLTRDAEMLRQAIDGDNNATGLWNADIELYDDDDVSGGKHPTLRGIVPASAIHLGESRKLGLLSHFLAPARETGFFCDRFPASYFPCRRTSASTSDAGMSLLHYNRILQQAFQTVSDVFWVRA
ncbi:hypothetical protein PINS_up004696 [Pythium insidiosum]|nr:hypothetical protein PINS_up004696 [Pythium insidiosum]